MYEIRIESEYKRKKIKIIGFHYELVFAFFFRVEKLYFHRCTSFFRFCFRPTSKKGINVSDLCKGRMYAQTKETR